MMLQWIGVAMVVAGCGGVGFMMATGFRKEIQMLSQLHRLLNEMEWELQYHGTPLPELCRQAAAEASGSIREVFAEMQNELNKREHSDARTAMINILNAKRLPESVRRHLQYLGSSLGRYDLQGQIQGLRSVRAACKKNMQELEKGKTERVRGYQTLALCAGAAIAIILI